MKQNLHSKGKWDIYDLFQKDEYEEEIRKRWEVIRSQTGINSLLDCSISTDNSLPHVPRSSFIIS